MQRTSVTNKGAKKQEPFALRVKTALLLRGMDITELAKELGVARNTASMAINCGIYKPTAKRIAEYLNL